MPLGRERRARPGVALPERFGPHRPLAGHDGRAGRGGPRRRGARERRAFKGDVVRVLAAAAVVEAARAKGVGPVEGASGGGLEGGAAGAVRDVSRVGEGGGGTGDVLMFFIIIFIRGGESERRLRGKGESLCFGAMLRALLEKIEAVRSPLPRCAGRREKRRDERRRRRPSSEQERNKRKKLGRRSFRPEKRSLA